MKWLSIAETFRGLKMYKGVLVQSKARITIHSKKVRQKIWKLDVCEVFTEKKLNYRVSKVFVCEKVAERSFPFLFKTFSRFLNFKQSLTKAARFSHLNWQSGTERKTFSKVRTNKKLKLFPKLGYLERFFTWKCREWIIECDVKMEDNWVTFISTLPSGRKMFSNGMQS